MAQMGAGRLSYRRSPVAGEKSKGEAIVALLDELRTALGAEGVLEGQAAIEKAHSAWTRLGAPSAVLLPRTTAEVSTILRLANDAGQAIVPWGGLTGLVDGCYAQGVLALSLERMRAIEEIDVTGGLMRVQAGCVLQTACEAAEAQGLLLPLDLGARGSATIGGNISTNAGGNRVLRFGMMREIVLGLEVVLAGGEVIDAMNPLIKNNAGYDLKQMFIGSEGTLGVVTRAVLRLRPKPLSDNVALLAVDDFEALPRILRRLERALGGGLSAFEVMWSEFYELVTTAPALGRPILPPGHAFYVLVEAMGAEIEEDAARFERALADTLESGEVADAVVAKSGAERKAFWGLRDDVGQTARDGPIFAFDVSLGIAQMRAYVEEVREALLARWADALRLVVFGHLGDGNLHVIVGVGERSPQVRHAIEEAVYEPLRRRRGSISAEHGIGLQKRDFLSWSRSSAEIALMRTFKSTLDPRNILNPGKILTPEGVAEPVGLRKSA
jgi:FAD/FMN-containing dehydrogenase